MKTKVMWFLIGGLTAIAIATFVPLETQHVRAGQSIRFIMPWKESFTMHFPEVKHEIPKE